MPAGLEAEQGAAAGGLRGVHCMAWVAGQAWVVHLAHEQTHQAIAIKWNLKRLIQSGGDQGLCLCDCMAAGNKCATTLRTSGCPCSQHAISAAVVACCSMRSAIVLRPRMASQQSNGPSALPSAFCNAMDPWSSDSMGPSNFTLLLHISASTPCHSPW